MGEATSAPVALVTGSSSGLGAATAVALAAAGYRVVVNSAHTPERGQAVARTLPGGCYLQADISDANEAFALVERTVERCGRLDALVNNAGTTAVIAHRDLEAATPEIWRRILDVNLIGTWQVTAAAVPHLKARPGAAIVNVSSLSGHRASGSSIPYAVSKAAVSHLTRLLANALAPEIRVNAVAPGLIDTPWTADWREERAAWRAGAPLERSAAPEEVAGVIVALLGATFVTGEVVLVDGGMHLR